MLLSRYALTKMIGCWPKVRAWVINNEGYVLTSAAVLDAGPRFTVIASGSVELAADVELNEKDSGLGVLRAEGLSSTGLPLSTERPASGVRIFAVSPEIANDENRVIAGCGQ